MQEEMKVRKFRTAAGELATWTYTHDKPQTGAAVGTVTCTGCRGEVAGVMWPAGNEHAATCFQVP